MNFGRAIELLKAGAYVRRIGWDGKEMMSVHLVERYIAEDGTGVFGHMVLNTSNGCIKLGWNPSTADIFADDWEETFNLGGLSSSRDRRILDAVAKGAPFLIGGYLEYVAPETAKAIADIMDAFEAK